MQLKGPDMFWGEFGISVSSTTNSLNKVTLWNKIHYKVQDHKNQGKSFADWKCHEIEQALSHQAITPPPGHLQEIPKEPLALESPTPRKQTSFCPAHLRAERKGYDTALNTKLQVPLLPWDSRE